MASSDEFSAHRYARPWLWSVAAVVSIVLIALGYWVTLGTVPAVYVDEPWHAERVLSLLETGQFRQLSFPYSYGDIGDINPLGTWLHLQAVRAFGYDLVSVRLVSWLAFVASLPLWYRVVRERGGAAAGVIFLWLYALSLMVFFSAHIARFEAVILFLMALATWVGVALGRWLGVAPRFFLVGLIGSTAVFLHLPGAIVPIQAAVMAALLCGLDWRALRRAMLFAAAGVLTGLLAYLVLVDLSAVHYFVFGDYRKAVAVPLDAWDRLAGFLSMWYRQTVRGAWLAGPIYEGYLITAGFVVWMLAWLSFARTHANAASSQGVPIFLVGAMLALVLLALVGRPSDHYYAYLAPWLNGALAIAIVSLWTLGRVWRLLTVATFLVLAVRLAVYVEFTWRDSREEYARQLRAVIPAGETVLGTIDHGLFFRPGYRFVAIDDLQVGDLIKGTLTAEDYIANYEIDWVVLNSNDKAWINNAAKTRPWAAGLLEQINNRAQLVATVSDDYFYTGVPGFHGPPLGGVLWALRPKGASQTLQPVTEIWRVRQSGKP